MRTSAWIAALLVSATTAACGSTAATSHRPDSKTIAEAKRAHGFAPFADIFPRSTGSVRCSVSAGPYPNVFHGRCSASVSRRGEGPATVAFTQDFGVHGRHVWRVLVSASGRARVVSQSGGGLVQLIP